MKKSKGLVSTLFGIVVIVAAVSAPAAADDDIETKAQGCASATAATACRPIRKSFRSSGGSRAVISTRNCTTTAAATRSNATMTLIAKGVTLPDLRQFADYFAAKTWPAKRAASAAARAA